MRSFPDAGCAHPHVPEISRPSPTVWRVNGPVASETERDQIVLGILTATAPEPHVVDFNYTHQSAELAPPAIPLQNLFAQGCVFLQIQPSAPTLWRRLTHAASLICCKNSCFCAAGRNRKNRNIDSNRIWGFPSFRCAPARKSAQIISRQ